MFEIVRRAWVLFTIRFFKFLAVDVGLGLNGAVLERPA